MSPPTYPYETVQRYVLAAKLHSYLLDHTAAIRVLSEGIEQHADAPQLYRHRGEFLLTILRLDEALADCARAEALLADHDDEIDFYQAQLVPEMEALLLGRSLSLLHAPTPVTRETMARWRDAYKSGLKASNAYHDALASYLSGDVARAAERFADAHRLAISDDTRSAATNWRYLSLRRSGAAGDAQRILEESPDAFATNEGSYAFLIDVYRGRLSDDSIAARVAAMPHRARVTCSYGHGAWLALEGREEEAVGVLRGTLALGDATAFGHLAARVDLERMGGGGV